MAIAALPTSRHRFRFIATAFAILICSTMAGCVQFAANIMNAVKGPPIAAEFKGLDKKKVAVVCGTESGFCGDEVAIRMAGNVRGILSKKIPKATFVNQEDIDQWIKGTPTTDEGLIAIGRGVRSDYVLGIQISGLKLKDGATLYRGRSDVAVTVIDTQSGKAVYRKSLPEYTYPQLAGQSTTEMDEDRFQRAYLLTLADKICRSFYAHEIGEDVAIDATILQY